MIKLKEFVVLVFFIIINSNNLTRTQFVNYFNATKPYELQISIIVSKSIF